MGKVNQIVFEMAEKIIDHFQLREEDSDQVQKIILDNASNYHIDDFDKVKNYFRDIVLCPQCGSLDGHRCTCWKTHHFNARRKNGILF